MQLSSATVNLPAYNPVYNLCIGYVGRKSLVKAVNTTLTAQMEGTVPVNKRSANFHPTQRTQRFTAAILSLRFGRCVSYVRCVLA